MDTLSPASTISTDIQSPFAEPVSPPKGISEWETKRFAVVIVCYKNLFQTLKDITPKILEGFQSIIVYSLNCFIDSSYEVILKRTLDITLAFCEFFTTFRGRTNVSDDIIVNDAFLFILQRFPSKYSCDACSVLSPKAFLHLQFSIQILTQALMSDIPRFVKNPVDIVKIASKIHYSSGEDTESQQSSLESPLDSSSFDSDTGSGSGSSPNVDADAGSDDNGNDNGNDNSMSD
jgi:hypothetical protein